MSGSRDRREGPKRGLSGPGRASGGIWRDPSAATGRGGGKVSSRSVSGECRQQPTVILAKPQQQDKEFPTLAQSSAAEFPRGTTTPEDEAPQAPPPPQVLGLAAAVGRLGLLPPPPKKDPNEGLSKDDPEAAARRSEPDPCSVEYYFPKEDSGIDGQVRTSVKLIDEQMQFHPAGLAQLLRAAGQDFLVVGVIGMQGTGKSTTLNCLAAAAGGAAPFRVQSLERAVLGEHCSDGVEAWVCPRSRLILLDSQPVNSPSVLDRALGQLAGELSKGGKFNNSILPADGGVETQSLQVAGFLLAVCHVVLVVQDYFVDPSALEFLRMAEMLRHSSPALASETADKVVEYFPEVIFVHTKASLADFSGTALREVRTFYGHAMSGSQLRFATGRIGETPQSLIIQDGGGDAVAAEATPEVNIFILPSYDLDGPPPQQESDETCQLPRISFEELAAELRKGIASIIRPSPLTTAAMSEKAWLTFAQKSWDATRLSPFYAEYTRILSASGSS